MAGFSTNAIHQGGAPDSVTGAIIPPIYLTSTYLQEYPGEHKGYVYTRANNPNFTRLEEVLASLEKAKFATLFSSGLGALTALLSSLSAGDVVIALEDMYGGSYRLFHQVFTRFGIDFRLVKGNSLHQIEELMSLRPKWLFFETPSNPLLNVYDIEALAEVAHRYNALVIVDNTFATPYLQNPLEWGADAVWHSTTKYINGHSDVLGGVVMTNSKEIHHKIKSARTSMGLNPSPFDAWLTHRGVKTLALRMEQHQKNALSVAQFLQHHPKVKRVYFPGFQRESHARVVAKQMKGFGGMVTAEFDLPSTGVKQLASSFQLFSLAESLGGIESLVNYPATLFKIALPVDLQKSLNLTEELLRFSVGIEDVNDLIHDLRTALNNV